jgi:hypothetical protein
LVLFFLKYFETKFNVKAEDTRNLNMAFNNKELGFQILIRLKRIMLSYDIK